MKAKKSEALAEVEFHLEANQDSGDWFVYLAIDEETGTIHKFCSQMAMKFVEKYAGYVFDLAISYTVFQLDFDTHFSENINDSFDYNLITALEE